MCQKIQPAAANKSRERQARSFAYLCGSGERDSRLARRLLGEGSRRGCRPHALPTTRPFLAPRPLAVHLWSRRSCQHVSRWSPPRFGPLPSPRGPASVPGARTAALRREIHRRHIRSRQGPSSLPRGPRSRPSPPSSAKLLLTHDPSWHLAFLVCSRLWKSSRSWLLSHQQSRGRAAPGSSGASAGEARRAPRERDGALIEVSLVTGCSPGPPSPGGVSRRSRGVVSSETGNIWW